MLKSVLWFWFLVGGWIIRKCEPGHLSTKCVFVTYLRETYMIPFPEWTKTVLIFGVCSFILCMMIKTVLNSHLFGIQSYRLRFLLESLEYFRVSLFILRLLPGILNFLISVFTFHSTSFLPESSSGKNHVCHVRWFRLLLFTWRLLFCPDMTLVIYWALNVK